MAASGRSMRMKLMVDKTSNRVVYAEADNDVVNFFFGFLRFRILTTATIMAQEKHGLSKLHTSLREMAPSCVDGRPDEILKEFPGSLIIPKDQCKKLFRCAERNSCKYVSFDAVTKCPGCHRPMTKEMEFIGDNDEAYVNSSRRYMIMDDLVIEPFCSTSGFSALSKISLAGNMTDVDEIDVEIGAGEGLALLKTSLMSRTVLTDVFLKRINMPPLSAPTSRGKIC